MPHIEWSLALTSTLMGLLTGPHCVAMCSAPCASVCASARAGRGCADTSATPSWRDTLPDALRLHGGRVIGYALVGALAGGSMQAVGWLHLNTAVFKPLWTLTHVLVLVWGMILLVLARQPVWATQVGGKALQYIGRVTQRPGGLWLAGSLWALLPCGMLYSAVLIAALATSPWGGALNMALFALGTSVSLLASTGVWQSLRRMKAQYITRSAGALLCVAAGFALFTDMSARLLALCQ